MILLGTSALLIWTLDEVKLPPDAKRAIEETERIVISSMSIWEIGTKANKGKLELPLTLSEYVDDIQELKVEILSVDLLTWLKNVELNWRHRDPADRTIVATALLLDCPLVTSDLAIRDFYPKAVW